MAIEKKQIPFAPPRGLYLDGPTVPGALSKAENIIILQDGTMERRPSERTLAESAACLSGRGPRRIYELLKSDSTRYLFADMEQSETTTSAFGAELVDQFASWIAASGWTYGASKWTHTSGTTALSAIVTGPTNDFTPSIGATYRIVTDITCPIPAATAEWVYTHTDSTFDWITKTGNSETVWLNQWTHSTAGTTALICADFTPAIGSSYVVQVHVTHTSGTSVAVTMGGLTLGTITATGTYTYIARYCTTADYLKFTPTSDWRGSINKTWPRVQNLLDNWCSAVKLITPDAPNLPSYYDYTASPHFPTSIYYNGAELITNQPTGWYPGAAAYISQSVVVGLGGVSNSVTTSGVYTFDITATSVAALTFTPTTSWTGSVNSASVQVLTQGTAGTKTKVIGGEVTGTTDYEVVWSTVLSDLTSGAAVIPQWATLQDRCFRVDGTNKNYWFTDASEYHTLGCPAPTSDPVTANTTGGSILAGSYNVYYTYVKKYGSGSSLYVVEGSPSKASSTTVTGSAISCTVVACTESDVSHIRIYRTLYGEPGSYAYFDQEVANVTNTVTLIQSDDEIRDINTTLECDHDMPPIGKYILGAGSRLWLVDTQGTMHWSLLDQPELMPSQNYMTFDPKDGDVAMGMCPLRKHILVFKRRRTWLLDMFSESTSDDGTAQLAKDVVSSNIGCVATGSIQPVGTDSAIWLSHAGFILYNGGSIKNISTGHTDSDGNSTPSRIQSVINTFMQNGAENYIESAYHSTRHLYHVNFIYRNAANTTIVSQRHFVYNIDTDTWTEYVYRDSSGNKTYETNFALAHDSLGNEVLLIPYLSSTTGVLTYIYQGEYSATAGSGAIEILDSDGDGVTAFSNPSFSFVDNSDNIYVGTRGGNVFKRTPAGVKSTILLGSALTTALSQTGSSSLFYLHHVDLSNNVFYATCFYGITSGTYYLVKITFAGAVTLLDSVPYGGETASGIYFADLYATGSALYYIYQISTGFSVKKYASGAASSYYTITGNYGTTDIQGSIYSIQIYEDDLYVLWAAPTLYTNYQIIKLTTITGTAAASIIDTGINATTYSHGGSILVNSATEIIVEAMTATKSTLYSVAYSGGAWAATEVVPAYTVTSGDDYPHANLIKTTAGNYMVCNYSESLGVFDSSWQLISEVNSDYVTGLTGISHYVSSAAVENIYVLCGSTTSNVYAIYPDSGWEIGDDEPALEGTVIDIVSHYYDLGAANDKRVSRVYLPIESECPSWGSMTLEPGYEINTTVHANGEDAEPSGATSLRPFIHPGVKTWKYTNDQFDSTVEQWIQYRLDIGCRGKEFRYSIRAGDVSSGNTGRYRIRSPRIDIQLLSKQ
ncbi:MAG: hypothetical protein WC364_13395 [Eubacteriales bacterium]|jgi:hypothetical protein